MDIVDKVTYDFKWDDERDLAEQTRQAFVKIFNEDDMDAQLVMRFLVGVCKWQNITEYNDPVIEAKINSLRNVMLAIKQQLNMKEIGEYDGNDGQI